MPGLLRTAAQFGNAAAPRCSPPAAFVGSAGSNGIWSKHRDGVTFDQLQKFWSELPPHTRQQLLKIDKQMLFEQARKNLYCSRCNGLLLEVFSQIVMYGRSLHQEGGVVYPPRKAGDTESQINEESDYLQDPYVHPWGGLVATRDGILTLLDCYIYGKSLHVLQNVFDSARARERERELLYPDACGGGGRGWISQSTATYSRGHGTRETCALHTARLSCDTLVDFWSALGDETRLSLLSMKEEDFIERLMYRFDSKRFCRDCRRNVIREFKELKELKRMRRETRCTNWFCVADTTFQYEVSDDTVQADWHQYFTDSIGTFHHFEWAIGTGEGKSDILAFEDVGMNGKVQANGLDLAGLSACFITLRAWRLDGRCTELIVKAHALKGQPCVHRRLVVGDGFVTITSGENIRSFFEHAEEAEEEEDEDSIDKDGNEIDDDGFRPQKHAKSPELAREFLLDAATVIFKEQVEKAFREGTARQNAHSMFVCLSLKLLEERVLVACKEIITWEKQIKLLEEEEKEKREEEERKEKRRMKEREKKLRRKERLKEKERERERKNTESKSLPPVLLSRPTDEFSSSTTHEQPKTLDSENSAGSSKIMILPRSVSPDCVDKYSSAYVKSEITAEGGTASFMLEQSKSSRQKLRLKNSLPEIAFKECDKRPSTSGNVDAALPDESEKHFHRYMMGSSRCMNGEYRQSRGNVVKTNARNCGPRFTEKFHCSNSRVCDRYDSHSGGFNQHGDYRVKDGQHIPTMRPDREIKIVSRTQIFDTRGTFYQRGKYGRGCFMPENFVISKGKFSTGNTQRSRGDARYMKRIWEPMDSQKKSSRKDSDPDGTSRTTSQIETEEAGCRVENKSETHSVLKECESPGPGPFGVSANSVKVEALEPYQFEESSSIVAGCDKFGLGTNSHYYSKIDADEEVDLFPVTSAFSMNNSHDPLMSSSSSENCSSYLSEGDGSTSSSSTQNTESSSTSDSDDASQQLEGRETSCTENTLEDCQHASVDDKFKASGICSAKRNVSGFPMTGCTSANFPREGPPKAVHSPDNGLVGYGVPPQQPHVLPMHPAFPPTAIGYSNQRAASWTALPGNQMVSLHQPNQYMVPCPLGYGLPMYPSSDFCMQYNALQPLTGPMVNVSQFPSCQFSNEANIVHLNQSNGQPRNIKSSRIQSSYIPERHPPPHPVSGEQLSPNAWPSGENGSIGKPAKLHGDAPSFSLFHFGGPVAVAAGCNLDPALLGGESDSNFPSNSLEGNTDHSCSREGAKVEEYSLFASGDHAILSFLR